MISSFYSHYLPYIVCFVSDWSIKFPTHNHFQEDRTETMFSKLSHLVSLIAVAIFVAIVFTKITQYDTNVFIFGGTDTSMGYNSHASDFLRNITPQSYQHFYDEIKCITKKSSEPCTFPLLMDYNQQCSFFAESTSWENVSSGFPTAKMSAQICQLPPVTSAPKRLVEYIEQNHISKIVIFGDSQGREYENALIDLIREPSLNFTCSLKRYEPTGLNIYLDYYTANSGFITNATLARTCRVCNSNMYLCKDKKGHSVTIEYLSMSMAYPNPINVNHPACKHNKSHPLCQKITQQEYVFKHYLAKAKRYPQLLLFFSAFAHDGPKALDKTYDGIQYILGLITAHVPQYSTVIWYDCPPFHEKLVERWRTREGPGFNPNDKLQKQNHFLSQVLINHRQSGGSPRIYSFFDLFHTERQLRGRWVKDHVHSRRDWYRFVMGYTVAMLPSIPTLYE